MDPGTDERHASCLSLRSPQENRVNHVNGKNNRTMTSRHLFRHSQYRRYKLFRPFHLRHMAGAIDGDER